MAFKTIQILNQVERRFKERLQRKTNWGRNEVIDEYQESIKDVIDKQTDTEYDEPLLG